MVESGLVSNTTVSHYRLSLHLFFAFHNYFFFNLELFKL